MIRKCSVFSGKDGGENSPLFETNEYIDVKKYPVEVAARTRDHKVLEFEIPKMDKESGSLEGLHPDLRSIAQMMSASAHNKLFRIHYQLEVFIKHQSKLEFGKGNQTIFDIIVRGQGEPVDFLK